MHCGGAAALVGIGLSEFGPRDVVCLLALVLAGRAIVVDHGDVAREFGQRGRSCASKQLETLSGEDPQVAPIKKEAVAAIGAGDYAE